MNTSNPSPWGTDWESWFKSPWWSQQAGEMTQLDPSAAFASMTKMWFGGHPVFAMPAGSMSSLMKDAAMAWSDLMRQTASHQAILLKGWQAAFSAFGNDLTMGVPTVSDVAEGDTIESLDELVARWTATAEPILQQHARSEDFIKSQGTLMRAAMKWQKAQAAVSESLCNQMGIPTRNEVDEAFRMIHELRRSRRRDEYAQRNSSAAPSRVTKRKTGTAVRRGDN